jgi:carbon-monoxide dehydrogenase medium subunit
MDIAVVGCGVSLVLREDRMIQVRVALGAVAPTPLLAQEAAAILEGQPIMDNVIDAATEAARKATRPITDMRGTAEYRRVLSGVLMRRALHNAIDRARKVQHV